MHFQRIVKLNWQFICLTEVNNVKNSFLPVPKTQHDIHWQCKSGWFGSNVWSAHFKIMLQAIYFYVIFSHMLYDRNSAASY
jgi:hypothetical protein